MLIAMFCIARYAFEVPGIVLDQWCEANQTKPDFIKVDVEGAELQVLAGACKVIERRRPIVMFEFSVRPGYPVPETITYFETRDYVINIIDIYELLNPEKGWDPRNYKTSEVPFLHDKLIHLDVRRLFERTFVCNLIAIPREVRPGLERGIQVVAWNQAYDHLAYPNSSEEAGVATKLGPGSFKTIARRFLPRTLAGKVRKLFGS